MTDTREMCQVLSFPTGGRFHPGGKLVTLPVLQLRPGARSSHERQQMSPFPKTSLPSPSPSASAFLHTPTHTHTLTRTTRPLKCKDPSSELNGSPPNSHPELQLPGPRGVLVCGDRAFEEGTEGNEAIRVDSNPARPVSSQEEDARTQTHRGQISRSCEEKESTPYTSQETSL